FIAAAILRRAVRARSGYRRIRPPRKFPATRRPAIRSASVTAGAGPPPPPAGAGGAPPAPPGPRRTRPPPAPPPAPPHRSPSRPDRMNVDYRRSDRVSIRITEGSDAGRSVKQGNVGGSATHVEGDETIGTDGAGQRGGADHARGRT